MLSYPYDVTLASDMLEIVDNNDKPFMLQKYKYAHSFPHRSVMLILKNKLGKVLLWSKLEEPKTWDFLFTTVYAGQAKEDTAQQLLKENLSFLGIELPKLQCPEFISNVPRFLGRDMIIKAPQSAVKIKENKQSWFIFTTFFVINLPHSHQDFAHKDLLWVDMDELQGFSTYFREMLGSKILMLLEQGYLQKIL